MGHTCAVHSTDRTSWTLILGAAAGEPLDREAFSQRYAPAIRAYLGARWRSHAQADTVFDASQDVMVECFKDDGALSRVDPQQQGGFRAYLFGIVRNVALMAERRYARRREVDGGAHFDADQVRANDATLSFVFDREFARSVTRQARERMARRSVRSPAAEQRYRALALQFEHGVPPREVAAEMDLAPERVYELLKEGRRDYRDSLFEVMRHLHPGATQPELESHCVELLQLLQ